MQVLYGADRNPQQPDELGGEFLRQRLRADDLREFAAELVAGVRTNQPELDRAIGQTAANWSLSRMTPVDRSILRLATYELLFCPATPTKVVIDEAIELAKRYGTADSFRFVNGILDRIAALHRSDVQPAAGGADPPHPAVTSAGVGASIP